MKKFEVSVLNKNNMLETFDVEYDKKKKEFSHEGNKYSINAKYMFLNIAKNELKPCLFYIEGNKEPIKFSLKLEKEKMPSRVLHLLWNHGLYRVLVQLDKDKTNLIVIALLIISIALFGIRIYFNGGF